MTSTCRFQTAKATGQDLFDVLRIIYFCHNPQNPYMLPGSSCVACSGTTSTGSYPTSLISSLMSDSQPLCAVKHEWIKKYPKCCLFLLIALLDELLILRYSTGDSGTEKKSNMPIPVIIIGGPTQCSKCSYTQSAGKLMHIACSQSPQNVYVETLKIVV